jgi:hypothetical protein
MHCFSLREKGVRRRIFRGERVFEEKSKIFLQKHARPNRFLNGRFLSVAKNNLSRPSTGARSV